MSRSLAGTMTAIAEADLGHVSLVNVTDTGPDGPGGTGGRATGTIKRPLHGCGEVSNGHSDVAAFSFYILRRFAFKKLRFLWKIRRNSHTFRA
jgi:hypothetical protein